MNLISENPYAYLAIAIIMFSLGLVTVLTRTNILAILMGLELMLNASALNFITFAFFRNSSILVNGHIFAIFVIILAAAETVVAFAIVLTIFHQRQTVMSDKLNKLKG